jgi:hypothetical protein
MLHDSYVATFKAQLQALNPRVRIGVRESSMFNFSSFSIGVWFFTL